MNLRSRLFLMASFALLLQIVALCGLYYYYIAPQIAGLEKNLVEKNLHRGLEILQRELFHLEHITQTLAELEIMKFLATSPSPDAISRKNLQDKMLQLDINLMYILNNSNDVIWESILDLNAEQSYPDQPFLTDAWEKRPKFLEHSTLTSLQGGILNTTLGPMLVVSAPIAAIKGKQVQGTLITGKLITQDMIHLIQSISFTDVKLWPLGGSHLSQKQIDIIRHLTQSDSDFMVEKSGNLYRGFMTLQDLNEQPTLLISVTQSINFTNMLNISLIEAGAILFIMQISLLLMIYWMIHRALFLPAREMVEQINDNREEWQPPQQQTKPWNELGLLTNAVSAYLSHQQWDVTQKIALAYRDGISHARQSLFRELQETLTPLIEGIELTDKKLSNLPINEIEWIIAESKTGQISLDKIAQYAEQLQSINEKLRHYQKETRLRLYELYSKALRNAAALRAQSRSLDIVRQFTPVSRYTRKKKSPMARSE